MKKKCGLTPEQTDKETQRFVAQYAEAWKKQEAGTAVIVWMWMSRTSICFKAPSKRLEGWYSSWAPSKRFIIHAMTSFGMSDIEDVQPNGDLNRLGPSAMLVEDFIGANGGLPRHKPSRVGSASALTARCRRTAAATRA